jgi:hypothetical protein
MYQKASGGSVVLGTTNGFPSLMSIMTNKKMAGYYSSFDVVIVEEAGRATLAETIYPISWVREDGKVILVGDHNQLPAYGIDSQKQRETIRELVNNGYDEARLKQYFSYKNINEYKESLFQALYEKSKYFIKAVNKHFLCINRRSHWAIARMISDVFYESRIVPDPDRVDERLERDTINVIDYDKGTDRKDNEKTSGTSIVNRAEARIVLDEVDRFLSQGKDGNYRYSAGDITIITPYEAQTKKIERMLEIKAVLNAIRTREIFSMPAEERYARFELLEYFLGTDPAFSQEVMTALGRVKKAKNKTKEKDIKTVLESESFLFFNNKHSERDFTFEDLKRIKIENVDSIQGSENKVVILSLVRSNTSGDIGFLGTKDGLQRLNVAFSRAREKFTVVGDFANTLCIADPRKNGKYNKDTERTVEAFRKVLEVYQELYDDKNMGGSEAWNEAVINAVIRKHIEKGAVVKISFKRGFFCYKPRVIDVSLPGYGNVEKTVSPVLTREEEKRLLKYIINSLNSVEAPAAQLGLTDIRVGIIKETAYVNPPGDGTFSIVHTGARTATIWFGELFLKDILAEEKDEDTQALMDHEIRHILDPFGAVMDHRQSWYEDLKYRMQTRAEKVRGQKETRRMLDNIAQYAHKAGDNKKLFIGLDTSWFSNAGELKVLMSYISKLSGKDNIVIKTGKGPGLASLIEEEIKDRDFSNVVVLGSEKTINNPAFNVMKNVSYGKRAFFAKIDPRQLRPALSPGEYYYIRVIEMINIALTLAFGERVSLKNIQQSYPGVRIRSTRDPKIYYFIPTAEPVELKELNELYKAQTRVIFSA